LKVKIGGKTYSTDDEPIMVIFNSSDLENLKNLIKTECDIYCGFPKGLDHGEVNKWMETE
jgi:hypothetical protein